MRNVSWRDYPRVSNYLALAFLFGLKLFIFYNVLARYLFNQPTPGVVQITRLYLMVGLVVFAWPYIHLNNENIAVTSISERFVSARTKTYRDFAYNLALIVLLLIIMYSILEQTVYLTARRATTSGIIGLPTYVSWWILTLGVVLLLAAAVQQAYEYYREIR